MIWAIRAMLVFGGYLLFREFIARRVNPTGEAYIGEGQLQLIGTDVIRGKWYWAMRSDMVSEVVNKMLDDPENLNLSADGAAKFRQSYAACRFAVSETIQRVSLANSPLPTKTLVFAKVNVTSPPCASITKQTWNWPTLEKKPQFFVTARGFALPPINGWNIVICKSVILSSPTADGKEEEVLSSKDIEALQGYVGYYAKLSALTTVENVNRIKADNAALRSQKDEYAKALADTSAERDWARLEARQPYAPGFEPQGHGTLPALQGIWTMLLIMGAVGFAIGWYVLPQYLKEYSQQQCGIIGAAIFAGGYWLYDHYKRK